MLSLLFTPPALTSCCHPACVLPPPSLHALHQAMLEWRDAFKQVAAILGCAGLTSGDSGEPDVVGVLGVLREAKAAQESAQVGDLGGARGGVAQGTELEAGEGGRAGRKTPPSFLVQSPRGCLSLFLSPSLSNCLHASLLCLSASPSVFLDTSHPRVYLAAHLVTPTFPPVQPASLLCIPLRRTWRG
jgi:hypothetical protein